MNYSMKLYKHIGIEVKTLTVRYCHYAGNYDIPASLANKAPHMYIPLMPTFYNSIIQDNMSSTDMFKDYQWSQGSLSQVAPEYTMTSADEALPFYGNKVKLLSRQVDLEFSWYRPENKNLSLYTNSYVGHIHHVAPNMKKTDVNEFHNKWVIFNNQTNSSITNAQKEEFTPPGAPNDWNLGYWQYYPWNKRHETILKRHKEQRVTPTQSTATGGNIDQYYNNSIQKYSFYEKLNRNLAFTEKFCNQYKSSLSVAGYHPELYDALVISASPKDCCVPVDQPYTSMFDSALYVCVRGFVQYKFVDL